MVSIHLYYSHRKIFYLFLTKINSKMETLGVLTFLAIIGMAFWLLIFLALFIPFWITLFFVQQINPKLANRLVGSKEDPQAD